MGEITYLDLLIAAVSSSPDMLETGDSDLGLLKQQKMHTRPHEAS